MCNYEIIYDLFLMYRKLERGALTERQLDSLVRGEWPQPCRLGAIVTEICPLNPAELAANGS